MSFSRQVRDSESNYVLMKLKAYIGVIYYLDRQTTLDVNGRLTTVINNANPGDRIAILEFWREWYRDFFNTFLINHTT
ncbi:uncharacterized protein LY79DRAFT_672758 [Colletotrichum navitas]|uniref:Uncharacterized protein n=1 Tax=Colletotrichum navitas TaxID=681940 RepID=A0AAD8PRN0_9PEZI|nr:uncharacterized protein LY79DRAFT_672758 [Colletotrichum navitas]KAK1574653.1 hypothetical protein LY79DRAFT_672758 [Colletotrichum navitas]